MQNIRRFNIDTLRCRFKDQSRVFAFAVFIGVLNGCTFSDLTSFMQPQSGEEAEKPPLTEEPESKPLPYYAGVKGLTLYAQPSPDSEIVARLRLHQKVLRSKLVRGYAYVTVVESGETGWVDNGKLIWKLPAKTAPAKIETKTTLPETKPEEAAIKEPPTPVEPTTAPKPEKTDAWSKPQPGTVSPSSFNPF